MIPSGYKTSKVYSAVPTDGTGDLVFSRSNDTATRVNSAGLIEKVRTNLLLQSNTFTNAAWVKDGCTITAAYGTAPDGTMTASRAVFSAGDKTIYQLISATSVAGSLYVKGTVGQTIAWGITGSESIFTLDGTWQRFTKSIAGSTSSIQLNTYGGVTARDVLIWSAQLEYGDIATDYIPTTTAAVSVGPVANVPRLDYLGSSCPRLLLEPQRTNLVTFSEQFGNAAWGKTNITISANNATSPDGYQNADTSLSDGVNAVHIIASNIISFTSGTAYSFSVFAKKGTNNFMQLIISSTVGGMFANFDLNNGTVGTLGTLTGTTPTSSIVDYGNGWYRCVINFIPTATTSAYANFVIVTSASAARAEANTLSTSVILWGAQLEAGAYATSYIPTLGASVTRGAENCSKSSITSLIGQTEGTLFAEIVRTQSITGDAFLVAISDNSANNWIFLGTENTGGRFYLRASNSVIIDNLPALSVGTHKLALAYKSGSITGYIDGVQIFTSSSSFTIGSLTGTSIGSPSPTLTANVSTAGAVKQALLFKTRLSNNALAELTTL